MKIDINKKYRYRSGKPARILCVDAPDGDDPVISMNDAGYVYRHKPDGIYYASGNSQYDLIEIREPREWTIGISTDERCVATGPWPNRGEAIRVREIID